MCFFRKCFVAAACFAFLTSCSAKELDAATCDQTCNAKVVWYWASSQTLARQFYGAVILATPHSQCVISHESRYAGMFSAYDGTGNYGAFQFSQNTFDSVVSRHGRSDLVGKPPMEPYVPWWDQAAAAGWLYAERGDLPWGSRC